MPLDRLFLILVCVIAAAGFTIWAGTALIASSQISPVITLGVLLIISLVIYVVWRLLAERLNNPDEDHYDKMDH